MKKSIAVITSLAMLLSLFSISGFAVDNNTDEVVENINTVGDLFAQFGVDGTNANTTFYLVENIEDGFNSDSRVAGATADHDQLVAVTENEDGSIDVLAIGAAVEQGDDIALTDICVDGVTPMSVFSSPVGSVTGSTLDYTSQLSSAYDYYFALGTSYSYITRSGYYAFRPSSVYCYVRKSSTATKTVSSLTLGFGLSGYVITSATSAKGDNTIFPESSSMFPKTFTNPVSGKQYNTSLTAQWAAEGLTTSQYLWCYEASHAFGISLIIKYSDGKYVYVEHAIVAERI